MLGYDYPHNNRYMCTSICTSMWSRPRILKTTLAKYKEYAKTHGIKLWKAFDKGIEALNKEE